ncbi:MAG: hypothetical protein ACTSR8_11765 [Promethearchaeota archaeon]
MCATSTDDSLEIDCYEKILNYFNNCQDPREIKEIWKSRSLITLMKKLISTQNKRLIRNALILLLSLFEDMPPDIFNNRGIDINRLTGNDRDLVLSKLKGEFLPN